MHRMIKSGDTVVTAEQFIESMNPDMNTLQMWVQCTSNAAKCVMEHDDDDCDAVPGNLRWLIKAAPVAEELVRILMEQFPIDDPGE